MADHARTKTEPLLVRRERAAELLGVCLRTFDDHIARELPRVKVGTRVLYDPEDLRAWRDKKKAGPSTATSAPASTPSGSGSKVVVITDRRAREIEERLSRAPRKSTRRS